MCSPRAQTQADIGIKNHRISAIGKGGNPDVMDGITPGMIVGVNTEVIAGEKLIVTYGAFDAHGKFAPFTERYEPRGLAFSHEKLVLKLRKLILRGLRFPPWCAMA